MFSSSKEGVEETVQILPVVPKFQIVYLRWHWIIDQSTFSTQKLEGAYSHFSNKPHLDTEH